MDYIYNYFEDLSYEVMQHEEKKIWYISEAGSKQPVSVLKQITLEESQIYLVCQEHQHENIVEIKKIGRINGKDGLFVEMEYVRGETLGEWIDLLSQKYNSYFLLETTIRISLKICDGLQYFHELGYNHRDLSRNNVMMYMGEKLDSIEVKIIDFGNCHLIDPEAGKDTISLGTMDYAAPEQYGGKTDQTTDIFALGRLMCEMLTGDAENFEQSSDLIENNDMKSIVKRCSRMDKDERYSNIYDIRSELQKLFDKLIVRKTKSKNSIYNDFLLWYDDEFKKNFKGVMLEDSNPIQVPIYVVLVPTLIFVVLLGYININIGMGLLIFGFFPYNALVGWIFEKRFQSMEFLYPYSLGISQIKEKLIPTLMILNYKYEFVSENKIIIAPHKKRRYVVSVDIEKHSMNIVSDDDMKCTIRNVFKRSEDYGKIVYAIQHINHF